VFRGARLVGSLRPRAGFAPLKAVDLSRVGLGDNMMLWSGLYALLDSQRPVCAPDCVIYVPAELRTICAHLFSRFGIQVTAGQPPQQTGPLFSPLPPENVVEACMTYLGTDWRMNWVEALDRQKTFARLGSNDTFKKRVRLRISERVLYKRADWREARPEYIGYRVWYPLARKLGVSPEQFMSDMKRSLAPMRQAMSEYVDNVQTNIRPADIPDTAIFPAGKSFQSMPPETCAAIKNAPHEGEIKFYIQNNDPWIGKFTAAGITPENLDTIDALFKVIKSTRHVVSTDSFSSHIAQFMRDDFVLVLSRDLRENIVHPGANPHIVANHPGCAPCNYHARTDLSTCLAGYSHCIAFDKPEFVQEIVWASRESNPAADDQHAASLRDE
jgi:hypothetical protein